MKTSKNGLDLIKRFEGLRLKSYVCPAGVLTCCYGSTGSHVKPGQTWTKNQCETLLRSDLVRFENAINSDVKVPLTQSQFDSLVSFCFNVGIGAFKSSTLLKLLNAGKYTEAAGQFKRWTIGGGKVLPGLVTRRKAEEALFNTK